MLTRPALALAAALVAAAALATAAAADPPLDVAPAQLRAALACPAAFTHPAREPVLLVHGTGLTPSQSWSWNYLKALPPRGFDVCTVALPDAALGDIQVASEYVVYAIERIHALTGRRVAVITHSQGGMEGRWAVRWWPAARADVADLIDLASPNHGIAAADLCGDSGNCWPAVWQMRSNAAFIHALNSGGETPGAVSYTQVYSRSDELVEPSATAPLAGGANTSNVAVQDVCPGRVVHHGGMLDDAVVFALVVDALTHPGPANLARLPRTVCAQALAPGITPADAAYGNALLYSSAAVAFDQHPGVRSEPPLKPYAH